MTSLLQRLGAFALRLLGGHQRQAFAGFGEFDGRVLLSHLPHGEVERVADVDGERTVVSLLLRPDEMGGGLHRNSLLTFSVGAGAAENGLDGGPTRVTTAVRTYSAAPAGGLPGRPIGIPDSAVPGFTARRMELNLSAATIARQLTEHGIPTSARVVSGWESGTYCPLEHRIDALAEILGVTRTVVEGWFGVEIVGSHR